MKNIITVFILFLGTQIYAQSKKDKVKELIQITGAEKMLFVGFQQFMDHYNNKYKDLPSNFWDEFKSEITTDKIINSYIPIYDKYYTEGDLDELIKFYKTPIGKKMILTMPLLMQDASAFGQNYVQDLNKRVNEKLNKHYNFQSPPPPSTTVEKNK